MKANTKKKGRAEDDDVAKAHMRCTAAGERNAMTGKPDRRGAKLDRATQTRIGDQLRAMYGELLEQPVPDRFRALLAELDAVKAGDGGASDAERADSQQAASQPGSAGARARVDGGGEEQEASR